MTFMKGFSYAFFMVSGSHLLRCPSGAPCLCGPGKGDRQWTEPVER